MRLYLLAVALLACVNQTTAASAQDRLPPFARGGLGAGLGTVDSRHGYVQPSATGAGLQWDAALGVFVTPWLALHGSAFGHVSPSAAPPPSCVDDCGPNRRETIWAQTYGVGLTAAPAQGLGRSGLRPFVSTSAGLAITSAPLSHGVAGTGVQLLLGLDYEIRHGLRVGLALQGMFEGKRSFQLATEDGFKGGHAGGVITVSFDRRAVQR